MFLGNTKHIIHWNKFWKVLKSGEQKGNCGTGNIKNKIMILKQWNTVIFHRYMRSRAHWEGSTIFSLTTFLWTQQRHRNVIIGSLDIGWDSFDMERNTFSVKGISSSSSLCFIIQYNNFSLVLNKGNDPYKVVYLYLGTRCVCRKV